MKFEILSPGYMPYLTLISVALIAVCVPLLWARKVGLTVALRKSGIVALLVVPIAISIAMTLSDNTFEMNGKRLFIRSGYSSDYSGDLHNFDLNNAYIGSLESGPKAKLEWHKGGISLPGMNAGVFSMSGGQSIFVILTDRSSVLYLPAKSGPSILVSVRNPSEILKALKQENTEH